MTRAEAAPMAPAICCSTRSTSAASAMLAGAAPSDADGPRDLTPLRGRGLNAPQAFLGLRLNPNRLTQSLPQDGADQNL